MNKIMRTVVLLPLVCLTACSANTSNIDGIIAQQAATETVAPVETTAPPAPEVDVSPEMAANGDYDIDLTMLESNMVYAEVYSMVYEADEFAGKTVRARGTFAYYQDPDTQKDYFAVLISDAAACCAQGIEFVLDGDYVYPDDYPEVGSQITIHGEFDTYVESGTTYIQLLHAEIEA